MSAFSDIMKKEETWNEEGEEILTGELGKKVDYEDWSGVDVVENSLCTVCEKSGRTIMILHKVPHFRELIIASFKCDHCAHTNNEVTFGGEIQVQGSAIELKVTKPSDLNRQLIKSDFASVKIPEIDFEIPPGTQKGEISTIEGVLSQAAKALQLYQADRMTQQPEIGIKVAQIIMQLNCYARGDEDEMPFTVIVDDISGNSYIENPSAPAKDENLKTTKYNRTPEQDVSMGLEPSQSGAYNTGDGSYDKLIPGQDKGFGANRTETFNESQEAPIAISADCHNCGKNGELLSAMTTIPHFKEVLIMAFTCKHCGYKTSEVKGGGAIPPMGQSITLRIESATDLKRDILKGDSAMLQIPELDLEVSHGSLGGLYTTVEGLLNKVYTNLRDNNPFAVGDASSLHHSKEEASDKKEFKTYLQKMLAYAEGREYPVTLIVRDPLGNSFISAPLGSFLPPESDKNIDLEDYERTWDENEDFGLNDMNTKDFETVPEEYRDVSKIQPDRLTHVVPKGADHPIAFAQGTLDGDSTSAQHHPFAERVGGGKVDLISESEEVTAPEGYSAERVAYGGMQDESRMLVSHSDNDKEWDGVLPPTYGRRDMGDDTVLSGMEGGFAPREEFAGYREGCVFRLGSLGLGYYKDVRKTK